MYMASLGSILESLLAISITKGGGGGGVSHALQARKDHIAVLAIANTISRLVIGAISDYLSTPTEVIEENGNRRGGRRRVSRLMFLVGACACLALVYAWGGTGLATEDGLWIVTISEFRLFAQLESSADVLLHMTVNGFSYGAVFTLSPAIVRSCWPVEHFGRNWGLLT
jgi:MFS family permease